MDSFYYFCNTIWLLVGQCIGYQFHVLNRAKMDALCLAIILTYIYCSKKYE